ncbi:hypothetical protein GCM10022228_07720 [Halomonas cibimaris]|uniref:Tyr recombinase domain-containing protein n=1 Tax=Halomonas cibimaris TaxID=657012 RepID=A0ABP7LDC3_9GAMM
MARLNAVRLIGQWQNEKRSIVQPVSLPDTKWVLEAIFGDVPVSSVDLDTAFVETLADGLFEWRLSDKRPITRKHARKRVNRVLQQLNQIPGMQAVLIPEPIPTHRPTPWPTTARSLDIGEQMVQLDKNILSWCRRTAQPDAWLLVLAIRLMTRFGMGETTALGTLAMLTREHISQRWWAIPAAPGEQLAEGGHYQIRLPDDVWVPLRAVLSREGNKRPTGWLLFSPEGAPLDYRQRVKQLRTRLKTATKQCLKEREQNADSDNWCRLRTWSTLVNASQYVPLLRGIPPLWARMLRQYPLPTCTPVPLLSESETAHWYTPGERYGRLPDRPTIANASAPVPELGQQTQPAGLALIDTDHLPVGWARQAKNLLRQFLAEVAEMDTKKVSAARFEPPMKDRLLRHEKKLVRLIGHSGSYPQWVLHFLYHQLRTKGNKVGTARTQLSRLTPITMMLQNAILDLSDWDDDVVLELQEAATSGANWSDGTLAAFYKTMRQFMAFCQQYGALEGITLPRNATSSLAPSVLRTRILSPDHMETVWNSLVDHVPAGDPRQMMALVIALGFYGGLRASEVLSLTLNNVVMQNGAGEGEHTCWIEVEGGKTSAARRRVALHVMAPPSVIEQMNTWVNNRRKECSASLLADIALFGPRHSPDAFARESLITPVIGWMRYVLGEDIDFHGLRHAAVSWTLLRLYAAQKPAFKATLHHRYHWMFCDTALDATLAHFCGAEGDDTLARGTQLLHVAKWIGHRDAGTLLQHYAHTLGIIHSDVLAPQARA